MPVVVNKKTKKDNTVGAKSQRKQHVQRHLLHPHWNKKNPYVKQYRFSRWLWTGPFSSLQSATFQFLPFRPRIYVSLTRLVKQHWHWQTVGLQLRSLPLLRKEIVHVFHILPSCHDLSRLLVDANKVLNFFCHFVSSITQPFITFSTGINCSIWDKETLDHITFTDKNWSSQWKSSKISLQLCMD